MAKPVDCPYFYGDYFRGNNKEECRLIAANPENRRPWRRKLCDSCPVPEILRTTNCRDLRLEAAVVRRFLRDRVEITFAVCGEHLEELADPRYCPHCAAETRTLD